MRHPHLSQRSFLKTALAGTFAPIFAIVQRVIAFGGQNLRGLADPAGNQATATTRRTLSSSSTPDAAYLSLPKFNLSEPLDGAKLNNLRRVTFNWQAFPGAASYLLEIITPNGKKDTFTTSRNKHEPTWNSCPGVGCSPGRWWRWIPMASRLGYKCSFVFKSPHRPHRTRTTAGVGMGIKTYFRLWCGTPCP